MKFPWTKLLFFLVPAAAAALFLLWWFSPARVVTRQLDALFSTVEMKGFGLGASPGERARRLAGMLDPGFELDAPHPLPRGPLPPPVAGDLLREFHYSITSCAITRDSAAVAFPAPDRAVVQSSLEADVRAGAATSRIIRYRARFEFRKSRRSWLLHSATLTPL